MTSRDTLARAAAACGGALDVRAAAVARGDAQGVRADVTNGDMLAGAAATAMSGDMLAGVARFDRGHFEGLLMAGFWGKGLA